MQLFPVTFGHNAFAFNEHLNADGTVDGTKVDDTVTIDRVEWDPTYRDLRDPLHLAQGGTLGRVHKSFGYFRLVGRILVPDASQQARLADREFAMRAALDPYLCFLASPTTDGAFAFDHSEYTADTANYPDGRIPLRYYARPAVGPKITRDFADRSERPYSAGFVLGDPRLYEQTERTLALTPAAASGNVANPGTAPAPLKVTIVTSGNGAANFTLARGGVSFVLDLSAVGAATIVIVMETCGPYGEGRRITDDGTDAPQLKTSGPSTWLDVPVGTTSFAISNHLNITSATLAWRPARA